ncbi:MAG TPA: radical SAM family heme chaperone HemW [Xanthomonadales bacterium]|nr:radical SAM family heme chaperone HemW [Xanthomonadales bacterium]
MNSPVEVTSALNLPPLSLYVHLPWCVKKCPYCDFNSHALKGEIPAEEYIGALLADLENDLPLVWGRSVQSVFLGGGTPSLFSAGQIDRILAGVRSRLQLAPGAEVTLEANPGTVEHDSFAAYRDAGINRVSLGVQSFDDAALRRIGRIHGRNEVDKAIQSIGDAGLDNFNLDLMFGLPQQSLQDALRDLNQALGFGPAHLSHYQLTLEPNTGFAAQPPVLPGEDECWEMQQACAQVLDEAGFIQYEISAWALPGRQCAHNLNYWRFGDYLGIGAGAHGKVTLPATGVIRRLVKPRHPAAYLRSPKNANWYAETREIAGPERCFEFFLNQLRLRGGVDLDHFTPRTGLDWQAAQSAVQEAEHKGLLVRRGRKLMPTELGWRFINDTQALFLPRVD